MELCDQITGLYSTIKKCCSINYLTKQHPLYFKKKFDYAEYGGAVFLGVKGICIKAHGSSDAKAFKNAIRQAVTTYENGVILKIKNELEKVVTENSEVE